MKDGMMSRKAAAEYLGVSVSWLARTQMGPRVVWLAGKARYLREDLDAYIEINRSAACLPGET